LAQRPEEAVSTSAARTEAPRVTARSAAWAAPSRLVASFSGTVGLALKIALLSIVNAASLWAAFVLADNEKWAALALLVLATLAIDVVYLGGKRFLPAKFILPGTVFLLAFQVIPIIYTIEVAFTNYSTGHILTKQQAIDGIEASTLAQPANGKTYTMAPARDADGKLVLILVDDESGAAFVGNREGMKPLPKGAVKTDVDGLVVGAEGYKVVKGAGLLALDRVLSSYTVPTGGNKAVQAQGLDVAVELEPTVRYDARTDTFVSLTNGAVYRDNGRGSFVTDRGKEIEPGWRTNVGFRNFDRLLHDPLVRSPFLRVFVWTFAFATLTVLFSFVLGLFLAIALDKPGLRFQKGYRAALVIPYAIPGFLSLLVWQGLLNDDFGIVNRVFHVHVPWLFDANWAKVSIIIVSTWLTAPYFFLVSMGALQSIPTELTEAARVDGGGAWQVFRRVTLPLLLVAVAPLMIASFAFNFNNFGNIYLLTGGGPASSDNSVAGATDILISYTYKLAFVSGKGQDYGLASAISILIFVIVATISAISFSKTKALENLA
jgi:arabinogalactan oligomer/maltooligosaccharide transport system permease protein